MRERGLKYFCPSLAAKRPRVAPHAGAWIEIQSDPESADLPVVAPHAGAWIEIYESPGRTSSTKKVAPHAGAWIEI